jgi:hypothetical protein
MMKHAGPAALERLEPFLAELRAISLLKERSRGTFYRGSRAFLHFHEHGEDLYADVRFADEWERLPVMTKEQRLTLKRRLQQACEAGRQKA